MNNASVKKLIVSLFTMINKNFLKIVELISYAEAADSSNRTIQSFHDSDEIHEI